MPSLVWDPLKEHLMAPKDCPLKQRKRPVIIRLEVQRRCYLCERKSGTPMLLLKLVYMRYWVTSLVPPRRLTPLVIKQRR